jgi:hypothetical protein
MSEEASPSCDLVVGRASKIVQRLEDEMELVGGLHACRGFARFLGVTAMYGGEEV